MNSYGILIEKDGTLHKALMLGKDDQDIERQAKIFGMTGSYKSIFSGSYFCQEQGEEIRELVIRTGKITDANEKTFEEQMNVIEKKYQKLRTGQSID